MKSRIMIVTAAVLLLSSCTKDKLYLSNPNNCRYDTYTVQFQTIWGGINSCYAFWDIDGTNWDAVYSKYLPIFEGLDKQETVTDEQLLAVYDGMLGTLVDHHFNLSVVNIATKKIIDISPGIKQVARRDGYHENLQAVYGDVNPASCILKLSEDGRLSNYKNSYLNRNFAHSGIITKTEGGKDTRILLLRLDSFDIMERLDAETPEGEPKPMEAIENYLTLLADNSLKGIIIDIRSNGGGTVDDLQYVFGPMLKERYEFAQIRHKIGIGRYDYSAWSPYSVAPLSESRSGCYYDRSGIPLVVMIDMHSVSCSEVSAMLARSLPNGVILGERTFGGQGILDFDFESGFSGTFGSQSGNHYCYMASCAVSDLNGKCYEGVGITPDKEVAFNIRDWANRRDTQMEAAIDLIAGK